MADPKKPGWRSTEWWMSLGVVVLGALLASGWIGEGTFWAQLIGGGMALLGGATYTHGRARTKQANALAGSRVETAKALPRPPA